MQQKTNIIETNKLLLSAGNFNQNALRGIKALHHFYFRSGGANPVFGAIPKF